MSFLTVCSTLVIRLMPYSLICDPRRIKIFRQEQMTRADELIYTTGS